MLQGKPEVVSVSPFLRSMTNCPYMTIKFEIEKVHEMPIQISSTAILIVLFFIIILEWLRYIFFVQ